MHDRPDAGHPSAFRVRASDVVSVLVLAAVVGSFLARSWQAWGYLDSDYGREMFVPLRIAEGDLPYRDVRHPYGPLVPFLHAYLYRLWEPHLHVLYASGIAATVLGIASLYAVARQLSAAAVATLAVILAVVDLMFIPGAPGRFSYIFPYTFSVVYGLAFALLALAASLRLLVAGGAPLAALAGAATGCAILTKQEFAVVAVAASLCAVAGLHLLRRPRAWRCTLTLLGSAAALPVLGFGLLVWAASLHDIVQRGLFDAEYFGWPITWMIAGLRPGSGAREIAETLAIRFWASARWYCVPVLLVAGAALAGWRAPGAHAARWASVALRGLGVVAVGASAWLLIEACAPALAGKGLTPALRLRYGALPPLLGLWLLGETAVLLRSRWRGETLAAASLQRWIVVMVALVLLVRVVGALEPLNYANFYLGPGIVLMCVALGDLLPRWLGSLGGSERWARTTALCAMVLLATAIGAVRWSAWGERTERIVTPRGSLYLSPRDQWLPAYRAALDLILRRTPPNAKILAIPTESSLYFLSGRKNHLYETGLVAVVATEAAERRYIAELEKDPPDLVLISTRMQPEYGRLLFGVDYNRMIQSWIGSRYQPGETLGAGFRIQAWWPRAAGEQATLADVDVARDLTYDDSGGRRLRMDLYRPRGASTPLPVLMFLHGGGWIMGSKEDAIPETGRAPLAFEPGRSWPSMLPYLGRGMAVASVEYRLAQEAGAPAAVEDALRALYWLAAHAEEYGLDRRRIVVVGPSSGGHLALMVALTYDSGRILPLPEPGRRPVVIGAIDLYGVTDVEELLDAERRPWAEAWIGDAPDRLALAKRMSPLAHVHADAPAVLLVHSRADRVVPYVQAERLRDALQALGNDAELATLSDAKHGFFTPQENSFVVARILEFLSRLGLMRGR